MFTFIKISHSLIKQQFKSNNTMKYLLKITLFSIITLSFSGVYAQEAKTFGKRTGVSDAHDKTANQESEVTRRTSMNVTVPKQTQGATFGERKGWDGTVKGVSIQFLPSQEGLIVVFPDNIGFKVNEAEASITETKVKHSELSRTAATPIKGIIVKGGRNPGGQMKVIVPNASNGYDLPTNWTDGEYALTVAQEAANTEQQSTAKAKSVIIKFIVRKAQNNYEIVEQSIVNTTKSNTKD